MTVHKNASVASEAHDELLTHKSTGNASDSSSISDQANSNNYPVLRVAPPPPGAVDDLKRFFTFISQVNPSRIFLNLVAIKEGKQPLISHTFKRDDISGMIKLVKNYNQKGYNIYWTVNETHGGVNRKPKKLDIMRPWFVHVDIDPDIERYGSYTAARAALLLLLKDLIEKYRATLVIDSGNGIQIFWVLSYPLSADEVEAINKRLILLFGGDIGTQNIDRLERVPDTTNYSSKKKLEKGYPETSQAKILYSNPINRFDESLFPQVVKAAPPPPQNNTSASTEPHTTITATAKLEDMERIFQRRLASDMSALQLWQGHNFDDNSSVFMTVLNHAAFAFQKDADLILAELKRSPLGQTEWFKTRIARPDNIVQREIQNAIASQHNSYDPEYHNTEFDFSHDALAIEVGETFFYENARYVTTFGKWYFWEGTRWLVDDKAVHYAHIGDFLRMKANNLMEWAKAQEEKNNE